MSTVFIFPTEGCNFFLLGKTDLTYLLPPAHTYKISTLLYLAASRPPFTPLSLSPLQNPSALHFTSGNLRSVRFLTTLTSAAFVMRKFIRFLLSSAGAPSSDSLSFSTCANTSSCAFFVLSKIACMLPNTFSAALAKGKSVASTSSGESQDFTE